MAGMEWRRVATWGGGAEGKNLRAELEENFYLWAGSRKPQGKKDHRGKTRDWTQNVIENLTGDTHKSLEKALMLGKIEGRRRRGWQGEMVGRHHWFKGYELGQTPGDDEGLVCCSPWGRRVRHDLATEHHHHTRVFHFLRLLQARLKVLISTLLP